LVEGSATAQSMPYFVVAFENAVVSFSEHFVSASVRFIGSGFFVSFDSAFSRHWAYFADASSTSASHFCAFVGAA
jgi:hypothetical protein